MLLVYLRVSTNKRNGKTYRYAQLVESYRGKNGKPTARVVKHLGALPDEIVNALRLALKAAGSGDSVVLASEAAAVLCGSTVANLRYLDLAVLIDCWEHWELSSLFDRLEAQFKGGTETKLSLAQVVFALVGQRCCAPASKLHATRWFPTTALPELLGIDLPTFNNSRIHRALDDLHAVTARLQEELPRLYRRREGGFAVLFMDVTDTYFEGIGCPIAEQTRTKTEMPHKRCLSIVLLANEHGFPLRWKVLGGKTKDWTAMTEVVAELGDVEWLRDTPLVFDRAMGQPATLRKLKTMGLQFLTAAHRPSFESFTTQLPSAAFEDVEFEGTDEAYERDIERAAQTARQAGFEEIHERLFVIDLGVTTPVFEDIESSDEPQFYPGTAHQLLRARRIREELDTTPGRTQADIATAMGISATRVGHLLKLLRLEPEVQQRITELGQAWPVSEPQMRQWVRLSRQEQLAKLSEIEPSPSDGPTEIGPLRMVAYFNPRLFVDTRRRTQAHCDHLQTRVEELNAELAAAKRSREQAPTFRKFSGEVEHLRYLDAFDIALTEITVKSEKEGRPLRSYQGAITRKPEVWARKRRYDGFVLLLGHPHLKATAADMVQFYRQKDTVEKDFQTIKSVTKLRPVFHYTDPKVQAHVTICMLALLLQRTLRRRLIEADIHETAVSALNQLETCHLNQRAPLEGVPTYDVTQLNQRQTEIIEALGLNHLAESKFISSKLHSRALSD
jgi:hypothetical protein